MEFISQKLLAQFLQSSYREIGLAIFGKRGINLVGSSIDHIWHRDTRRQWHWTNLRKLTIV